MGVGIGEIELLKRFKSAGHLPSHGSVIEIGAQQINDSLLSADALLEEVRAVFGVKDPPPSFARSTERDPNNSLDGCPFSRDLWRWLGFDYASIDIDGSPGSIPLDLNFDEAPAGEVGKYSLVTNFGTTEHIANQAHAFKIIHDLTATDGIMLHNVPMSGMFNHGLISYNPKFFWMLGRVNGYKIVLMTLSANHELQPLPQDVLNEMSKYDPSIPARFSDHLSRACSLVVAFQKLLDAPFVPPLDFSEGVATEQQMDPRWWSIGRSNPLSQREAEFEARSKCLAEAEEALSIHKQALLHREQNVIEMEQLPRRIAELHARSTAILAREQSLAEAEETLSIRKKAVLDREQNVIEMEQLPRRIAELHARSTAILAREQSLAEAEETLSIRKKAVLDREQKAVEMERALSSEGGLRNVLIRALLNRKA